MNKKHEQRRRDIKSKLTAAICMLLVSSIMMVSSTYAWFTLSTAPEVTGITTAVGANGNLEMALLPYSTAPATVPESAVGDGAKATVAEKNVTWGNLVDVEEGYGLDKITLYPSKLNVGEDGKIVVSAPLSTPVYAADGRVDKLVANTVFAAYDSAKGFMETNKHTGVRGVGVSSGMTQRQLTYKTAKNTGTSASGLALTTAQNALKTNGAALASIAMNHAMDASYKHKVAELNDLKKMIEALDGSLEQLEKAYIQYILAYAASAASNATDEQVTAISLLAGTSGISLWDVTTNDEGTENTTKGLLSQLGANGVTLPEEFTQGTNKLKDTMDNVTSALEKVKTLINDAKADYTWDAVSSVVNLIANIDKMMVCGLPMSELKQKDQDGNYIHMNDLLQRINNIVVTVPTGSGVLADIADHAGNYTQLVTLPEGVKFSGISLGGLEVTLEAKTTVTPTYLSAALTAVEGAGAPTSEGTEMPLSDMYGYIIDMAFRTNASGSNLMLQQTAVDRIYSDNTNENTMGHGATMSFKSASTTFGEASVKSLMQSIRMVFMKKDGTILQYGKLDVATATTSVEKGVTAKIILCNAEGVANEGNKIMALDQNTQNEVSVLVYLDGENIKNADVAFDSATSMTGEMNLQFSSDATLVPMEYADLHQKGTTTGSTTPSATTDSTVPSGSEASDETVGGPSI